MNTNFLFLLNGKEYPFRKDLDILKKFHSSISQNLLEYSQYRIKSNVHESIIVDLIDYLSNKKRLLEITVENYYDYALLNDELQINELTILLNKKEYNDVLNMSMLKSVLSNDILDKSLCEQHISTHLDYYLKSYSDQLKCAPINSLYNIFYSNKRNLTDHNEAYAFLQKSIETNSNSSMYCVLFESLDASKLNSDNFTDAISKKSERFNFAPIIDFNYLDLVKNNYENLQNQQNIFNQNLLTIIDKLQNSIDNLSEDMDVIKKQISDNTTQLENTIVSSKKTIITETKDNMSTIFRIKKVNDNLPLEILQNKNKEGIFYYYAFSIGNPFISCNWKISGNSKRGFEKALIHLCERSDNSDWESKNEVNSYIMIYFGGNRFKFEAITIWHHSNEGNNIDALRRAGSNDGVNWDDKGIWNNLNSEKLLDKPSKSATLWNGDYDAEKSYKFMKFYMPKKNSNGNNCLCLGKFELYGKLEK